MANKVNGRVCISLQEHEGKKDTVSYNVLPEKRSHGDHKTWLDCSKTFHKARFRHTELLRAVECERGKVGENPAASFVPTVTPRSQPGAVAACERPELLGDSYRWGPKGGCPTASVMARAVSSVPTLMLSLPSFLSSFCGKTSNSKVHVHPLS